MQSANGGHDGRYLPSSMDYTGMTHHPHHPHHHLSASTDPHSGLHYALPPTSMPPSGHQPPHHHLATKRVTDLDMMGGNASSDEDGSMDIKPSLSERSGTGRGTPLKSGSEGPPTGKKTKGRVKIKMEFIDNKLRRYTTFSKRKTGIMKKAYELSTLTGTQVMLLVASETGHVYTFATRKLQPMITSDAGKALIQTCLNSPDPPPTVPTSDQRMSVSGYEETELTYNVADTEQQEKVVPTVAPEHAGGDSDDEDDGEEEEEIEMEDSEIHHQTQARQVQQRQSEVRFSPSAHHRTSSSSPMKQNEGSGQGKRKSSLPYLMTKEKVTKYSSTKMPPLVKAGYQMSSSEVLSNRPGPSSYLPAEVISQLLASGHHMREGHSSHQQMPRSQSSSGGQDIILPSSITITASRMPSTSRGPPKQP